MARLSPEAVLRTHQIYPYKDIKLMVERHGFTVREGNGTSHVTVSHPEHKDLIFSLNRSPGRIRDPQHNAAKACLEVLERASQHEVTAEAEESVAFPKDITARIKEDTLILRHKSYPCIGMALHYDSDRNGIADIASRRASTLRESASQLSDKLAEASDDYGIEVQVGERDITLAYMGHETVLSPFNTLTNQDPCEAVDEMIATVEQSLVSSREFCKFIQSQEITYDFVVDTDAERPYVSFTARNIFTGRSKQLGAPVQSNGAISDMDQIKMIQDMSAHMFEDGTFKALKERFGIKVTGKDGEQLFLKHPIFDLETDAPNPRKLISNARSVFERSVNNGDQDLEGYDISWLDGAIKTWGEMGSFAAIVSEHMEKNRRVVENINADIRELGLISRLRNFKKLGEPCTFTLSSPQGLEFSCPVSRVRFDGRNIESLIPPSRIDDLNNFIAEVREQTPRFEAAEPEYDPIGAAVRNIIGGLNYES